MIKKSSLKNRLKFVFLSFYLLKLHRRMQVKLEKNKNMLYFICSFKKRFFLRFILFQFNKKKCLPSMFEHRFLSFDIPFSTVNENKKKCS